MPQLGFRSSFRFLPLLAAGALLSTSLTFGDPARAEIAHDLAPHRAIYDLKLHDATDRSGIAGVDGRIVFDTTGSRCEGYAVTFRLVMRIFDTKGNAQLTDLQTSSFESKDGFNFTVRTFANGAQTEDTLGRAYHGSDGTEVELRKPEEKTVEIDSDVLFPTEHMHRILEKARAGEHLLQAENYDGSEGGERVFPTLTVIGAPIEPGEGVEAGKTDKGREADDPAAVEKIGEGQAWPVTVSYFEPGTRMEESEPNYEISFILHDNGVTRRLRLDYGDFSVDGRLVDIERYKPSEPCPGE